jgi:hypothetical protein
MWKTSITPAKLFHHSSKCAKPWYFKGFPTFPLILDPYYYYGYIRILFFSLNRCAVEERAPHPNASTLLLNGGYRYEIYL